MAATAYTTPTKMIAQYGIKLYQVLNVASGADISANAQLLDAIESANSTVDSFIRARYDPSAVSGQQVLINAAGAIAFWLYIVSNRPEMADSAGVAYNNNGNAMRDLRDIKKGATNGGMDLNFPPTDRTENLELIQVVRVGSNVAQDNPLSWARRLSVMRFRF